MENIYGYIGISDRVSTVDSGLYVDALPDISLDLLSKLTDNEDNEVANLWGRIEKRGILKFRTFFINAVNKCHQIRKIDICECLIDENIEILSIALWYLLGAEIMHERVNSARINKYTTIDKAKARELQTSYLETFQSELEVAINSIDVHDSECTETETISERNIITSIYVEP